MKIIKKEAPDVLYTKEVTTSDLAASFNLIDNNNHAVMIQNKGAAGLVLIRQRAAAAGKAPEQAPAGTGDAEIYLAVGQTIEVALSWENIYTTGTGAGVVIEAFFRQGF